MAGDWMRARGGGAHLASDSFLMLASLVALGRGRALLPVFFGDIWPGIERIDMPHNLAPVPVWVASHRDYARSGRLRRVRKVLLEGLTALGPRMMGEADTTPSARRSA
ncbi:LysR family transcriptional regulator [Silicimonas algicola]|nr:LysR family transcriptional regulator [Silicimonas algicola]AZQ67674.1 LysR family transcriptional regulator [Silicimonas algicola]